jgi:hypothetical protein
MHSRGLSEEEKVLFTGACPWCNKFCMYVEFDTPPNSAELIRVGSICDEADIAKELYGDAIGNDWGRSNWGNTLEEAIEDFMFNTEGAWVGEETPIFLNPMSLEDYTQLYEYEGYANDNKKNKK